MLSQGSGSSLALGWFPRLLPASPSSLLSHNVLLTHDSPLSLPYISLNGLLMLDRCLQTEAGRTALEVIFYSVGFYLPC